ncbi:MAG: hypothetical protein ACTSUO_04760 [Candidatus Thorarchaeota archaeon]
MMRKKRNGQIILFIIIISTTFNVFLLFLQSSADENPLTWLFTDLGPAIIQDSYSTRAPGLESPYGLIGDIPGGYSLYNGNPLQTSIPDTLSDWLVSQSDLILTNSQYNPIPLFLALGFTIIPLLFVLLMGRKSYGASKTY